MSADLSGSERLEIESACLRLVYEHLRALDQNDWEAVANCFADQGVLARPMQPDQLIEGRDAIRAAMHSRPKGLMTRHIASNVIINIDSRDRATGVTALVMIGCTPGEGSKPPFESTGPLYFGEFRDRFIRENGQWKFLERRGSIAIKY
jgi:ketosteroid isomerase-like protein